MFEGVEPCAKIIQEPTPLDVSPLKRRVPSVYLIAFNEKCVLPMASVELGNIWIPPLTITAELIDLNTCAVEMYYRLPVLCEVMYSLERPCRNVPQSSKSSMKRRAIIHKLPNARANDRMPRDIPEDFPIVRPAGYIDPLEQKGR